MWTRRKVTGSLIAGSALAALPAQALTNVAPEDWAERLRAALQARVTGPGAQISVSGFQLEPGAHGLAMRALVALDWAPGLRQRVVTAEAPDALAAFARLEAEAGRAFQGTCLDCGA
ncbi:MAG: hypothetical protein OIF48_08750 [Silicimonas sp.]|jgi:hypothetical protein|nr:hypothetical protein [Silicimonas sp.]